MIKKVWLKLPVSLRKSLKFLLGNKLYVAAFNKLYMVIVGSKSITKFKKMLIVRKLIDSLKLRKIF